MSKPATIIRMELLNDLCGVLNASELPVFVKVEVLERILGELRPRVDMEYQRDLLAYNASLADNAEEVES